MSGLQRAMRHPDRRTDVHARARGLASDELLGPLSDEDAAWLRRHLEACPSCRRTTASFSSDQSRIRALRDELPIPPRDLGARLSRALDVEVRRAIREDTRRGRSGAGPTTVAFAAIAIAAVVAIVLLPLTLGGFGNLNGPTGPGIGGNASPQPTPIVVALQTVAWVQRQPDGNYVLTSATVDQVCPGFDASACGTIDASAREIVALTIKPSAVILQHNGPSAVLVGNNAVYAFAVPFEDRVTLTPAPSSSIPTPGALSPTPAATGVAATPPAVTPVPTGSRTPHPTQTPPPSAAAPAVPPSGRSTAATPAASSGTGAGASPGEPAAASPGQTTAGEPAATETPAGAAGAVEGPSAPAVLASIPPASPAPSAALTTPIIEGVVLVGPPPAYSSDGQWVAFSARPLDGSQGPDIYVWRVGDAKARPLTNDHASVFSSWAVDQILGSAVMPAGSPALESRSVTLALAPSPAVASPAVPSLGGGSVAPLASGEATGSPETASAEPAASAKPAASAHPAASANPAASAGTAASAKPAASPATASGRPPASPAAASVKPLATTSPSPSGSLPVPGEGAATGSSPNESASTEAAPPPPGVPVTSFLLDPQSGFQTPITRPDVWRPVVDPTNRTVVFWMGTQSLDPATNTWAPASGQLVIADWQALIGPGDVTATPLPGPAGLPGVTSWDVRWDPSGRHLAVWIADPAGPTTGRLSLFGVNADGSLGDIQLAEMAALPGFSLGSDRLAWASPPGQNGQGSTVNVYAWSEGGSGSIHGLPDPGTDPLVVAH